MRTLLALFLCLAVGSIGYGQQVTTFLKLYANFPLGEDGAAAVDRTFEFTFPGRFSPVIGFMQKDGKTVHELELAALSFRRYAQNGRDNLADHALGAQYGLARRIGLAGDSQRWRFYLGGTAKAYYTYWENFEPLILNPDEFFLKEHTVYGVVFAVVPKVNFRLGRRWLLDAHLQLLNFTCEINQNYIHHPNLTEPQRESMWYHLDLSLYRYNFRFGIAYKI